MTKGLNANADTASFRRRVDMLRAEIAAAQKKERGVRAAILSRQTTLNRLEAQLALRGECSAARSCHE